MEEKQQYCLEMEKASSSTASGSGDNSLNGLKFGEKIYFEDVGGSGSSKTMAAPMVQAEAPPPEMKGKGVAQQKLPRCQVEGCNLDLTGAKAYYCRHKVCGMHSKSPKVFVAGLEQRFCQQCSRFHLLTEFDQGKRSCRRRLAGHNERRRKPLLGPLISRYGRLASFHEDKSRSHRGFLMDFTYPRPQIVARDAWTTSEWEANNQWQVSFNARPGFVPGNPHPTLFSPPELEPGDCLVGISNSSCALSLLSTPSWDAAAAAAAPPRNHAASANSASTECDGSPMAQRNMACSYMNSPCAFEDHHASGSSSLEMGLRHMQDTNDAHFSNELGLALQARNRKWPDELGYHEVYHDHDHHQIMHWSLYE